LAYIEAEKIVTPVLGRLDNAQKQAA
jgi:hypothetical protein